MKTLIPSLTALVLVGSVLTYGLTSSDVGQVREPGLITAMTGCDPGGRVSLRVRPHNQETGNWCWAASAQMIMEFLKGSPNQCEQANDQFDRKNRACCQDPLSPASQVCSQGGWPQFGRYKFSSTIGGPDKPEGYDPALNPNWTWDKTHDPYLSWPELTDQICQGRPFAFSVKWWNSDPPSGHMSVVTGYYTTQSGQRKVITINPCSTEAGDDCLADIVELDYEKYIEQPQIYMHWIDFYDISP